ncbi:MAG: D-2-hydroxyacid dehydrogenase [Anaerolineales bacterium]|nr:MAG: D-2-hydroxyacid dehydrogenase [Anaerolineales bacterium]
MSDDPIRILATVAIPEAEVARIRAVSPRIEVHVYPTRDLREIPEELLGSTEILYTMHTLPEPDKVPNLRWIQAHTTGIDHFQGHALLNSDVIVTTMSGSSTPQMAEFALMSMLALGHRLPEILNSSHDAQWAEARHARFERRELFGSTVGILGYGSIGREIARLCHTLGAKILATKRDLKHLTDEGYTLEGLGDLEADIPDRLYPPQATRSMVSLCDFVVIALPLTAKTQGVVNAEVIKAMKPGAFLIDISRGGILDHGALVEALTSGHLAGAALDVYPVEPLPESSPLWEMRNVILSPHLAGSTPQYFPRAIDLFTLNLGRYLTDRPLLNRYNPAQGY